MTTLYLFAHQDDEIGVFHALAEATRRGEPVVCAYLTNGAWAGVTSERRNSESLKTLALLGVAASNVSLLGTNLAIADGRLVENLERAFDGLVQLMEQRRADGQGIQRIIMHAFEGGHHDHDAVYLLGTALAARYGLINQSRQFPLYRRPKDRWSMSFAAPLEANGAVEKLAVPFARRLSYLRLLANYRSQARVILKLLPHIVRDYVMVGAQKLQPISIARAADEPNAPPMLYEIWKLYSYADFRRNAQPFIDRHLVRPGTPDAASGRIA